MGILRLEIDSETSAFLDTSSSEWTKYERAIAEFGSDEFVTIAIEADSAFSPGALAKVVAISEAVRGIEGVERVDALSSVDLPWANVDGSVSLQPILGAESKGSASRAVSDWVASNTDIAPWLVSASGTVFAIHAFISDPIGRSRQSSVVRVVELGRSAGARVSGVPVFRAEVNKRTARELVQFVPVTAVLILGGCFLLFGRIDLLIAQVGCAAVSVIGTLGLMGLVGVPISLATLPLPAVLIALSAAYTIHFCVAVMSDREFSVQALAGTVSPLCFSALTTAIGFMSMASVGVDAIRHLAVFGASGIVIMLIAILTLGPAIVSTWRQDSLRRGSLDLVLAKATPFTSGSVSWATCYPRSVVAIWLAVSLIGLVGMYRLAFDSNIIQWFSPRDEVRIDYEAIREHLAGISPVNVTIARKDGLALSGVDVIAVDRFTRDLRIVPSVGAALGVGDLVTSLGNAWGGADQFEISPDVASQLMAVLEGYGWWSRLVSDSGAIANVAVLLDANGSDAIVGFSSDVSAWWSAEYEELYEVNTTGIMWEFARAQEAISRGQVSGLLIAGAVVALIVSVVFGSIPLALSAFLPAIPPILVVYGAMGYLGVPLDAATASIGAVAMGLAVDDSLHLGAAYADRRARGATGRSCVRIAFRDRLPVLLLTTLAVSTGFGVFCLSGFSVIQVFGLVSSATIVLCFVADATLFPALLVLLAPRAANLGSKAGFSL